MSQRRVLPPRSTRGKRQITNEEQQQRDSTLYSKIFTSLTALPTSTKQIEQKPVNAVDHRLKQTRLSNNRMKFPFSRGYHYEYQLDQLQRVNGSPSYALDSSNILKVGYKQQDRKFKDSEVYDLINRKMIGLPLINETITGHIAQKNLCSIFLFQNQDKKYATDRLLIQLRHIEKRLQYFVTSGKIQSFTCLKKDVDLIALLEKNISLIDKRNIIVKKISTLQARRQAMKAFYTNQDSLYYDFSLDDKLHRAICHLEEEISKKYIVENLKRREYQRCSLQLLYQDPSKKLCYEDILPLFYYDNTAESCITSQGILDFIQTIKTQIFFQKDDSNFFQVEIPVSFLSFKDEKIMVILQQILIGKLINQGETIFYTYKSFWKKVFNRTLSVSKQPKHLGHSQFQKLLSNFISRLKKWNIQKKNVSYPKLDDNMNLHKPKSQDAKKHVIFSSGNYIKVTTEEYVGVCLFNRIYQGIQDIFYFLEASQQNIQTAIKLLTSDYYGKYHYVITEMTQSQKFGILQQAVKRAIEVLITPANSEQLNLIWVYLEEHGSGYFSRRVEETQSIEFIQSKQLKINQQNYCQKRNQEQEEELDKVIKKRKLISMVNDHNSMEQD